MKNFYILIVLFFIGCDSKSTTEGNPDIPPITVIDKTPNTPISIDTPIANNEDPLLDYQWHLNSTQTTLTNYASSVFHNLSSITRVQDILYATLSGRNNFDFAFAKVGVDLKKDETTYTGKGVTVAVIDNGIELNHPDLAVDESLSFEYRGRITDPSPTENQLDSGAVAATHGTCCAGIIAALGNNGIGVRGVAPDTILVGLNAFSSGTTAAFISAMLHKNELIDIYSNSWGDSPGGITQGEIEALIESATHGRNGKGSIFVFAGGNDRSSGVNANYFQELNSKHVITVAAIKADGNVANYSNPGANLLVSTFGGGEDGKSDPAIVTTDLTGLAFGYDNEKTHFDVEGNENGDYTYSMNGTSAACPMTAGVIALMLEANADLSLRDIRYILATTASQLDPFDTTTQLNGGQHLFSHDTGFGSINVDAAVSASETFIPLGTELVSVYYPPSTQELIIKAGETQSSEISLPFDYKVEFVDINVSLFHSDLADIEITLTSPSGMVAVLSDINSAFNSAYRDIFEDFRFGASCFLDEQSIGRWRLTVKNTSRFSDATLQQWKIRINGRTL